MLGELPEHGLRYLPSRPIQRVPQHLPVPWKISCKSRRLRSTSNRTIRRFHGKLTSKDRFRCVSVQTVIVWAKLRPTAPSRSWLKRRKQTFAPGGLTITNREVSTSHSIIAFLKRESRSLKSPELWRYRKFPPLWEQARGPDSGTLAVTYPRPGRHS